jgi:hypothetical protein
MRGFSALSIGVFIRWGQIDAVRSSRHLAHQLRNLAARTKAKNRRISSNRAPASVSLPLTACDEIQREIAELDLDGARRRIPRRRHHLRDGR